MDGHADADRLPIQKMRRYIRHIFQISASMRIAKNIRMAIPKLAISPFTSQKNISQFFFKTSLPVSSSYCCLDLLLILYLTNSTNLQIVRQLSIFFKRASFES